MGIKGIYKEIGPGKRISLSKLAVDQLEQTGRPLRLAIDISIWQFQVQAARGGSNPAIRTLFYRLLRLLSLSIQPIFVFDGPNKPVFKRNKRSGRGDGVATSMAKRLIRLFGFQVHDAPGEAEAECALLQLNGVVDAVLSEDVDTIMFGCTRTLRNWSAEGKGKTPTHMSLFDTKDLRQSESGLDREGMVLVALMSGGDYLPEGIPGAGVKLACEAARAGFGKTLCRFKRSDASGLNEWRDNLMHELRTNESRFFRTKHKALVVPEDFPSLEVLRYYTHPVVSPPSVLERLRNQPWDKPIDILGLREFVRETFDWNYRGGAIKFIRVLAPCLLVKRIMQLSATGTDHARSLEQIQEEEQSLVNSIKSRREHFSTDATPELRICFTPTEIVGYNFEEEPEEEIEYGRDGLALNSDDEFEALADEDGTGAVAKLGPKKPFSPNEPDLFWMPETIAKLGIPLMVEDWEETQRAKASKKRTTKAPKQTARLGGMAIGALDRFVKVSKNLPPSSTVTNTPLIAKPTSSSRSDNPLEVLPPSSQNRSALPATAFQLPKTSRPMRSSKQSTKPNPKKAPGTSRDPKADSSVNPWTIAGSRCSPRARKTVSTAPKSSEAIFISSSPPSSPTKSSRSRVRQTSSPPPAESGLDSFITSPQKRRSRTPLETTPDQSLKLQATSRASSPSPQQDGRTRRKLARTESMPANSPRGEKSQDVFSTRRSALTRARTIAVEASAAGAEYDGVDSDDDLDLPPLSTFAGKIPSRVSPIPPSFTPPDTILHPVIDIDSSPLSKPAAPRSIPAVCCPPTTTTAASPVTAKTGNRRQSKLNDAFGMRTTKIYAPRKSEPGFFKEIEVTVAEADRIGREGGRKWRMSDVSIIDLTGQ
ncbi:hypothetical protein JX266_009696 [Neoarthrinium moseri]|nr:hypothetical protein JX266_009696 [Neoarthrinium moseri]